MSTRAAGGAITRQRLFQNPLLASLPIVGVQEGEAVVTIKAEPAVGVADVAGTPATAAASSSSDPLAQLDLKTFRVSSSFLCTTCRVAFELSDELRTHSKTPWHVHNLRVRQRDPSSNAAAPTADGDDDEDRPFNGRVLSEVEFEELQANEQRAKAATQDDSASSGASTDEEEARDVVDEEDESSSTVGSSRITFYTPTQKMTVWKQILVHPDTPPSHLPLHLKSFGYVTALRDLGRQDAMCILMVSGGRFSGAIFKRDTLVVHKNFQRYTTRRKQGGSQSSYDSKNGQAHSIGSTIRRKETVRFREETERILDEWKDHIAACHHIFLFAPAANRLILMKILDKADTRIRNVPFPTFRPTLEEVKRIHTALTTVEFEDRVNPPYDLENHAAVDKSAKSSTASAKSKARNKPNVSAAASAAASASTDVDVASILPAPVTDDLLLNAVREGRLADVHALAQQQYNRPVGVGDARYRPLLYEAIASTAAAESKDAMVSWLLANEVDIDLNEQVLDAEDARRVICWSALHKACATSYEYGIAQLLLAGADPTMRDSRSRLPLPLMQSATVRLNIRRLVGTTPLLLAKHDWPTEADFHPLTSEAEAAAEEAKKAKAKEKKAKAKDREKKRKEEEKSAVAVAAQRAEEEMLRANQAKALRESAQLVKEATSARAATLGAMSDREKRAAAAERRLGAAAGTGAVCTLCRNPLTRTPFERLEFKYCTIACLQQHKAELDAKDGAPAAASKTKSTSFNPK